ncbi:MAG: hypothetical protein Q3974_07620 [Rothia sp. (in: high G+C Gram-positive bacteria)]|nr:hypothetical protein [Rothia sp. (in: high G+C Gram-positive bacteria)]
MARHRAQTDTNSAPSQQSPELTAGSENATSLDDGYEYVFEDELNNPQPVEEDESLSHQLFRHGTVVEKRSLVEKIQDRRDHQAQEKQERAEQLQRAHQEAPTTPQRVVAATGGASASTSAATNTSFDQRTPSIIAAPAKPQKSHAKTWALGGLVAALALVGGGSLYAATNMHQPESAAPVSQPSSTSASAKPSTSEAPKPTWSAKAPEVKYVEPTQEAVAPGQVQYAETAPAEVAQAPVAAPQTTQAAAPAQKATAEAAPPTATPQATVPATEKAEPTVAPPSAATTPTVAPPTAAPAKTQAPVVTPAIPAPTKAPQVAPTTAAPQNKVQSVAPQTQPTQAQTKQAQ